MKPIGLSEFVTLLSDGSTMVDTRKPEIFSEGFFMDSISIPWNENFINSFQELIENDSSVLLVIDEPDVSAVTSSLKNAGVTVQGYLDIRLDISAVPSKMRDMLITIDAEELRIDYRFDEFYLIDVRPSEEFEKEHLEHAENIAMSDLEQLLIELDASKSYYVYADTPPNAVTASSLFKRNGFGLVKAVFENFESIKSSGIPLVSRSQSGKSSAKFSDN